MKRLLFLLTASLGGLLVYLWLRGRPSAHGAIDVAERRSRDLVDRATEAARSATDQARATAHSLVDRAAERTSQAIETAATRAHEAIAGASESAKATAYNRPPEDEPGDVLPPRPSTPAPPYQGDREACNPPFVLSSLVTRHPPPPAGA